MPRPPAAALAALVLAGCATPSVYGSGPLRLSPEIQAAYAKYLGTAGRGAFAVSRDGTAAGESYCRIGTDCQGDPIRVALEGCRRSGKECFIYDVAGRIVWRGPTLEPAAPPPGGPEIEI